MFKLAKSLSPDTMLFLNDHGIIMDRFVITIFRTGMFFCLRFGRFELFQQQIRDLLAQGTPIDGLGEFCIPLSQNQGLPY